MYMYAHKLQNIPYPPPRSLCAANGTSRLNSDRKKESASRRFKIEINFAKIFMGVHVGRASYLSPETATP